MGHNLVLGANASSSICGEAGAHGVELIRILFALGLSLYNPGGPKRWDQERIWIGSPLNCACTSGCGFCAP